MNVIASATIPRRMSVVLGSPFRPFFLAAVLQAVLVVALGPLVASTTPAETAAAWHAHELLFGYVPAVQAGVLLTAVPSWTGRKPIAGAPLLGLLALWIVGRMAIAALGSGAALAATVSIAFPAMVALVVGFEIAAGRRFDQWPIVLVLVALVIAQALFHHEVADSGRSVFGQRLALAAVMTQFMVLAGRFVPILTRDFLARAAPASDATALPSPFGRLDAAALVLGVAALAAWIALPALGTPAPAAGVVLIAAGLLHLARQSRWTPHRIFGEPLLCVLHAGYAALPLGFLVAGIAALAAAPRLAVATTHVWAIGGTGLMTLAMMTRASLSHTGRALRAAAGTPIIYLAVAAALATRTAGVLAPQWAEALMPIAGLSWMAAYGGFLLLYGRMLVSPDIAARAA